jgi:hypothetical protein
LEINTMRSKEEEYLRKFSMFHVEHKR